ncbi:transposase [Limosilactobacillus reuteri]
MIKLSNRRIRNRTYLWKSAFWTQSYCLISTGGAPLEVVKRYIESQGRK